MFIDQKMQVISSCDLLFKRIFTLAIWCVVLLRRDNFTATRCGVKK